MDVLPPPPPPKSPSSLLLYPTSRRRLTYYVFEQEIPSDDERREFADGDVRVRVRRSRLGDSAAELRVTKSCKTLPS